MSIKVEVNEENRTDVCKEYPKLMKCKNTGAILKFYGPGIGFVINQCQVFNPHDLYSDKWNMDSFEPFYGSITITQER